MRVKYVWHTDSLPIYPGGLCFAEQEGQDEAGGGSDNKGGGDDGQGDAGNEPGEGLLAQADQISDPGEASGNTITYTNREGKSSELEVPKQFWDDEKGEVRTAALLKAFTDTKVDRDKLANGGDPAPAVENAADYIEDDMFEDNVFKLPSEGTERINPIDREDDGLKLFSEVAQKHGLTKEQFRGIASDFLIGANSLMPEPFSVDREAEKLGENAKAKVQGVRTFLDGLYKQGKLGEGEAGEQAWQAALNVGKTADGVKLIMGLAQAMGSPVNLPGNVDSDTPGSMTREEWYAQMGPIVEEHGRNSAEYKAWQATGARLFGTGPGGSSVAGLGQPQDQSTTRRKKAS